MLDSESKKGFFYFFATIVVVAFVIYFRSNICARVIVNGPSMQPTFHENDICWAIKNYELERYDVVVTNAEKGKHLIKRVIGLPGDQIKIQDGTVFINDEKINTEYDFFTESNGSVEYVCGDNEYFLLGDNRQNSSDSRKLGNFDRESIKGKVVFRFFPLNRIQKI